MLYCKVTFDRSGLGNRLFPWARCRVFSEVQQVPMLAPRWFWPLRIGPLFRGVHNVESLLHALQPREWYVGLFRHGRREITGTRRGAIERRARIVPEPADLNAKVPDDATGDVLVEFKDIGDYFARLNGWHEFLHRELRSIAKPERLTIADSVKGAPIGIHVRLGDFHRAKTAEELKRGGTRTPMEWYVESLRRVRDAMGYTAPAYILSDGTADELGPLVAEESVRLVRGDDPISGILALSQAKVLLGSGGSTFSAWAAFLGQMHAITMPGHPLSWHRFSSPAFVGEFDPATPAPELMEQLQNQRAPSI
jgi:hypothetical protein